MAIGKNGQARVLHLGIDVGTTAVKAAVYDGQGSQLSIASRDVETITQKPGWSEQNMDAVWLAVAAVTREAAGQIDSADVASVGVAGQGDGLWALDERRRPVRNAVLWNDQRAAAIVQQWIASGVSAELARFCRTAVWPGTSVAAYVWLRENEPDTGKQIETICKSIK